MDCGRVRVTGFLIREATELEAARRYSKMKCLRSMLSRAVNGLQCLQTRPDLLKTAQETPVIELRKFVVYFKPVSGGYVYRAPNNWLFGSGEHFLVTEGQKAAVLAIVTSTIRPVLWMTGLAWITLSVLLGMALSFWAYRAGYHASGMSGVSAMLSMLLSIYPAFLLSRQLLLHRLRPILATLPPTSERITRLEESQALQATPPVPISATRRRIVQICGAIAVVSTIGAMISRAIDMYEPNQSKLLTLYLANANLFGLVNIVTIVAFGFLFVTFGRQSSQP
jgi:hypothetical protein